MFLKGDWLSRSLPGRTRFSKTDSILGVEFIVAIDRMAYSNSSETIEKLAAEIGDNVYIDVAKWHLYLREAHLHTVLAEQLYPLLGKGTVSQERVRSLLQTIMVPLGGGKQELPLADLIPDSVQRRLMQVLEDSQW